MKKAPRSCPLLIIVFISLVYFSFLVNRGIIFYDEGYIAEASYLVYLGKIPYKEFFFQYTPLSAWLGAIWFKLFGVGILKLRWLALLISVATVSLSYLISEKFLGRLGGFFASLTIMFWTFPHANFLWPSSLSLFFFTLTLFLLLRFYETKNKSYIFWAGASAGLNLLSKQNLGLASLAAFGILSFLTFKKVEKPKILYFYYGAFLVILIGALIISFQNPTFVGISKFISRSVSAGIGETHFWPYPFFSKPNPGFYGIARWAGKMLLYNLAPASLVIGIFLLMKGKLENILLKTTFIFTIVHYWAVSWPTADLAHVGFGVPAIIMLFSSWKKIKIKGMRVFSIFSIIFLLGIGLYKANFMRYYTFEAPFRFQKNPITIREERILVDENHAFLSNSLLKAKEELFGDESVFIHPYAPMIYFILDKEPPVTELYTVDWILNEDSQREVINELKENNVNWVIIEIWRELGSKSQITQYIAENFSSVRKIGGLDVLKKIK